MTSPIPTEEALFRRELRCGGAGMENSQPLSPEDLAPGNMQTCSNTTGKKRKRRRKKHKVEPRKEEQTTPAGGEVELCELSSDEENNTASGQWLVDTHCLKALVLFVVNLFVNFIVSCLQGIFTFHDKGQYGPQATFPTHRPRMGQLSFL